LDAEQAKEAEEEEEDETKPKKERAEFDLTEFRVEFDTNTPKIEIPPQVVDAIDNDFDLPYTQP